MALQITEAELLLVLAGAGEGPRFITRQGAPVQADLSQALDLLTARRVQLGGTKEQTTDQKDEEEAVKHPAGSRELPEHLGVRRRR